MERWWASWRLSWIFHKKIKNYWEAPERSTLKQKNTQPRLLWTPLCKTSIPMKKRSHKNTKKKNNKGIKNSLRKNNWKLTLSMKSKRIRYFNNWERATASKVKTVKIFHLYLSQSISLIKEISVLSQIAKRPWKKVQTKPTHSIFLKTSKIKMRRNKKKLRKMVSSVKN